MDRCRFLFFVLGLATLASCTQIPQRQSSPYIFYVFHNKQEPIPLKRTPSFAMLIMGKTNSDIQQFKIKECSSQESEHPSCKQGLGTLNSSISLISANRDEIKTKIDLTVKIGRSSKFSSALNSPDLQSSIAMESSITEDVPVINDRQDVSVEADLPFNQWKAFELRHGLSFSVCVARDLEHPCPYIP